MIYINSENKNIKSALLSHNKKLFSLIKRRVLKCPNEDVRLYLRDSNIEILLKGTVEQIKEINNAFYDSVSSYSLDGFNQYRLNVDKKNKTLQEKQNVDKYRKLHIIVEKIFNYETSFSTKKMKYSTYDLAENLNINTCPYCNRIYTKTVINPDKITRPEFDHWFPKSKYPLLALSFFNLIPSCNVCNSSIKGSAEMATHTHFHPYIDKNDILNSEIKFSYYNKTLNKYGFKVISKSIKASNTLNSFKIEEIYKTHEDEIVDLRRIRDVYSESYLENLTTQFCGLVIPPEEIYRLAFGVYMDESSFDKRPLSKMKKDILIELGIIKQ